MISFNPNNNFNLYGAYNNMYGGRKNVVKKEEQDSSTLNVPKFRLVYKFDAEGNLICLTINTKTNAVIKKEIVDKASKNNNQAGKQWLA